MKLNVILSKLKYFNNYIDDFEVINITKDSRKVTPNSIYFNINKKYLDDAVKKGVKVIFTDEEITYKNVILLYAEDLYKTFAKALKTFYMTYKSCLIGVTGTCGKTTTTTLLFETIKLCHKNVLLIGTDGNYKYIDGLEISNDTCNTTPDIEIIYELIGSFKFEYIIIEVSSQGLENKRLLGLKFDYAVFLNLSNEHLDYHKNIRNYFNAKLKLFRQLKRNGIAIINENLINKKEVINVCKKYYTFGINCGDVQIAYQEVDLEKMKVKIQDKWVTTALTGFYNAENICAVYAIMNCLKLNINKLISCLENNFKLSGRLEILNYNTNQIIIDFAHTEKEVEVLLDHLKKYTKNHLYIIMGCGGNRDKNKRPVMGYLCSQNSSKVILTEDNSRKENPINIINDIIKGIKNKNYIVILNRFEAIKYGISLLKEQDILVIIGKGNEVTIIDNELYTDMQMVKEVIDNVEI